MSILLLALCGLLLLASFFFSGTETAFFALNRVNLRRLERDGSRRSARVLAVAAQPQDLLNTVLVGNNLVNVAISVLATMVVLENWPRFGVGGAIVVTTLTVLLLGEVTPKTLAIRFPETFARLAVDPYRLIRALLRPLTSAVAWLAALLLRAIGLKPIPPGHTSLFTRAELDTLLEGADEEGVMTARESELVQRILEFSQTRIEEIMTPRIDMAAAPADLEREELVTLVVAARHSRIPLYRRTIDDVIGYLKVRDFLLDPDRRRELLIRPVVIYPERALASKVFYEMQRQRSSMVIAVNEYGETVGMLTREDLVEEVVGEIWDEYESSRGPIRALGPGVWMCEGGANLEELGEELERELPTEDAVTLNGFLTGLYGALPPREARITWEDLVFIPLEVTRHRIQRVRVELRAGGDPGVDRSGDGGADRGGRRGPANGGAAPAGPP